MRHLLTPAALRAEIDMCPDPHMGRLLASHIQFIHDNDYEDGSLSAIVIEPGDSLEILDATLDFMLLTNHYSGKKNGDAGFTPCFETLEEYPTFYEMFFVMATTGSPH